MFSPNLKASDEEQRQAMASDSIVPNPMYIETRAITINASVERVWPWLLQMGSGRAGWYSYDWIDNGNHPSATSILPEYQHTAPGDILPALPGMKDVFLVTAIDPFCRLILTVPDATHGPRVSWEFFLKPLDQGHTRLIVRGRIAAHWLAAATQDNPAEQHRKIFIERVYSVMARIPKPVLVAVASSGHSFMQIRQLRGIKRRAEA